MRIRESSYVLLFNQFGIGQPSGVVGEGVVTHRLQAHPNTYKAHYKTALVDLGNADQLNRAADGLCSVLDRFGCGCVAGHSGRCLCFLTPQM